MTTATPIDFSVYDADQHYYEVADSFTRHLDPRYSYAFRWVTDKANGRTQLLVGDKVFRMISNPTFDPVGKPGALAAYFRGENTEGQSFKKMMGRMEPIRPEYTRRAERAVVMAGQGVAGAFLLPTLALGLEELLTDNPPALFAVLHALNAWIDEEWGFARDKMIIAPPVLSLMDPRLAEEELRWVIERGTKAIVLRPAPVVGPYGNRSPADPVYDRFWSMCEDADVAVAFHAADSGYAGHVRAWGERVQFASESTSALAEVLSVHIERPISETIAAAICHGLFDRHPRLRFASIELGSGWVPELLRRLRQSYRKIPYAFGADPVETFHEHIYVAPFQEDNLTVLLDHMRVDRVLFGSDWPHPEGFARPTDFIADIADLSPADKKKLMSDNFRSLIVLP
ncbi:amidohydrolase family protein [Frankia gtarii]|uniref:amidohydrolase family protein n=1 Tax=Frankia gtarii TaxID=2950102 RepID=UPI0021C1CE2E|nr:amidohydrolase family protein [Frankia gtarii]